MCETTCKTVYDENEIIGTENNSLYISDGLTYEKYSRAKLKNETLEQSDCCQLYYCKNAFDLKDNTMKDIHMCIHCFFVVNLSKFINPNALSSTDKAFLDYYLKEFSKDHNSNACKRAEENGLCLLCDFIKQSQTSDEQVCKIYDKICADKKISSRFTLCL